MKTIIGRINLIKEDQWPVQFSDFYGIALRLSDRTTASFSFEIDGEKISFPNDSNELEKLDLFDDEADRNANHYEHIARIGYESIPEQEYIKMVTQIDLVDLIKTIARDFPGKYVCVNDGNDVLIGISTIEHIRNIGRFLMAFRVKTNRWANTQKV